MEKYNEIKKASILGIFANTFLAIIKLIVGLFSKSQAMVADGLNSLGDIVTSTMTLIGNRIACKPKDNDHPYGHGKAEYIFSLMIGLVLIEFSLQIIKNAIDCYINNIHLTFSIWLVIVSIITIVIKFVLYMYTKNIAKRNKSILLLANSQDHRNDIFLTFGTLISIISSIFKLYYIDIIVAIFISFWIGYTAIKIIIESYRVLMDTNIDQKIIDNIKDIVLSINGVNHIDEIIAKPTGLKYLLIVKVSVPGEVSVNEGHKIAGIIREKVNELDTVNDTVVHINPC